MKFKLFVSYSSLDSDAVEQLKKQLSGTSIEVFIAEQSVQPCQELAATISHSINECDLFVVLWSENAKDSDWVSQEIGIAGAHRKSILPLVLSEGLNLPGFISGLKYLSIFKELNVGLIQANDIIMDFYNEKANKLALNEANRQRQMQKDNDRGLLTLLGIGAALWLFNSK